ncbi:MAG: CRISPR-associated endonuclease Cas1, partial [Chloroflexota bacterium]|nr:CRISPR-associated endonuclease Cas1 [Chloroflexota bacterium]
ILSSGVGISSDALRDCAERGIPVHFLSRSGNPYATLVSADLVGTARTRREQLMAFNDQRGAALSQAFASGKLHNQCTLLKYLAKNRKEKEPELFAQVREVALEVQRCGDAVTKLQATTADDLRPALLNLEGRGASLYWQAIQTLLRVDMDWPGRETRGATDPLNMALNYGYGILYSQVQMAALLAGLDPYAGFVHVDRAGKPSLVLDLIEEFRQPVVDRTVFGLVNKRVPITLADERLDEATRRLLAQHVLDRLDAEEPYEGKRHRLRVILQTQARHVATFVRGQGPYRPFVTRW